MYCGKEGHFITIRPAKAKSLSVIEEINLSPTALSPQTKRTLLRARLHGPHTLAALIDSSSHVCIISGDMAQQLGQIPLSYPIPF